MVNLKDKVECLEDLGLVDPQNDDKKVLSTLLRAFECDKYDSN